MPLAHRTRRGPSWHPPYTLLAAVIALSLGHHLDHVLRGATGWPFGSAPNPFTYSLAIYPAIAATLLLARRGLVGPRSWMALSGGGALFVAIVHLGPDAGDAVARIPAAYDSPLAGAFALVWLALFVVALGTAFAVDSAAWRRQRRRDRAGASPTAATDDSSRGPGLRAAIIRRPLLAFLVLSYALAWGWWLPLALRGDELGVGTWPSQVPGLFAPAIAAAIVTAATGGRAALRDLAARTSRWRVSPRWYAAAAAPIVAFCIVVGVLAAIGDGPRAADLGRFAGLPAAQPLALLALLVLVGLGEEIGWRGFALPHLLRGRTPLRASLLLAVPWAVWHLPLFVLSPALRGLGLPLFAIGLVPTLAVLSILLTRVYLRSGGSVLLAAICHAAYSWVSGTEAGAGDVAPALSGLLALVAVAIAVQELRTRTAGPAATAHAAARRAATA